MTSRSVADIPLLAQANQTMATAGTHLKKVPLRFWRMGLMALALLWICHTLASLFWLLVPAPELPVAPVTPATITMDSTPERDIDLEGLQAVKLFGDFNAQPVAQTEPEPVQQPLKRTELNLDLQGIIAANIPERSWAIIGRGAAQQLYKIGDEVQGARGVTISDIMAKKVILDNNGELEELWLYGEDGLQVASNDNYTPPRREPEPRAERATVSQSQLQQARNIGDVVRFMVATENGKMIGYKVRPGRQRELFDQVGLQADDIVVSVNGIEVNEPQKVREVYQALKTATEANLQVMRDGSLHSITITMQQ